VLDGGALGALFPVGDSAGLAGALIRLLDDPDARRGYSERASAGVRRYDWDVVGAQCWPCTRPSGWAPTG